MEEKIRRERIYDNGQNGRTNSHKCNMIDRKNVELSGIKSVVSFDTNEVLLETVMGGLLMKGIELHINQLNLDKGTVEVDGRIDALIYSNKSAEGNSAKSIMARLFR